MGAAGLRFSESCAASLHYGDTNHGNTLEFRDVGSELYAFQAFNQRMSAI
jgi:hypothetical protein